MGSLEVFVANATKVPNVETFGKSDPYITVEFQGEFCNFRKVNKFYVVPVETCWLAQTFANELKHVLNLQVYTLYTSHSIPLFH